ncbi:AcrR family transcriptional regulator [Paenibacillus shirakamiensis]|uniref:AcrR family transcriptional regulator n=1 Tax=Paenibacillus shirakamiensis TaxID=1265935 RepID=A0ABS4JGZ6_9BACL|nr:TetR/AcrR family transcriptional regulator [Paenibacillus shirakamiensis]MBP2000216.1 AcrR family transcriptional regulator [Paenibacillus shirakamiensis]
MNKKQLQSEQTKKKVADSARALFVQKGYTATSIEDIVAATGSSKGNIYYHFKSKEGLFLYLLDEWDREWLIHWQQKEASYKTITDKLYGVAEHLVTNDLNHPLTKAADEFFSNGNVKSDVEERISSMIKSHIGFNRDLLQQGMERKEFAASDADMLAVIMESLIVGLGQMSRKSDTESALILYKQAITVFLKGICEP